jgi:hypothetical protein
VTPSSDTVNQTTQTKESRLRKRHRNRDRETNTNMTANVSWLFFSVNEVPGALQAAQSFSTKLNGTAQFAPFCFY